MVKYTEELIIAGLIFISLFGLLATSSEPIISLFDGITLAKAFLLENEIFFSISSSLFVSTIFYLIIIYLPERRKKLKIQPTINRLVQDILYSGESVISSLNQHAPIEFKLHKNSDYSEANIKSSCLQINPRAPIDSSGIHNCSIGQQLSDRVKFANESCEKLFSFMPYLDVNLLHEVEKIYNSHLGKVVYVVTIKEYSQVYSLEVLAKPLFEYHKILKSIAIIHKKTNRDYQNPLFFD